MEYNKYRSLMTDEIDKALAGYAAMPGGEEHAAAVYEAMRYALFPGGKRLRPLILLSVCEGLGGGQELAMPFACALEMIHCYSLIHDDLPAMDDDDMRRGKPACHIAFGEGTAILAGDALLNTAYEIMARACIENGTAAVKAMNVIAEAAGACGMIGGQIADILYENKRVNEQTLNYIHKHKTAALFAGAAEAGALLAGADNERALRLTKAGKAFGLAFQIMDDIADAEEETDKNTYITVHGMRKAREDFETLFKESVAGFSAECGAESFTVWLISRLSG
ncbi:MAG: polyprenyl synthetase family protein [Clostridiales bacterium]|jgi:geranylgeranyl diphosphate synthase type II|nr:polyprenyl synthetase family protein [Clostridiales bacterium]